MAYETIRWYHHLAALPIRILTSLNLGPFGGDNSISAVIEAVLATKKGMTVDFPLSKSDIFFVQQFTKTEPPAEVIEYRELSYEAQREVLRRWGGQSLGVIWIGAGVFTLEHPLIAQRKAQDWHVWTDKLPKVVAGAKEVYQAMFHRGEMGNLSFHIEIPGDVVKLNEVIALIGPLVDHLLIMGYGVTYALTMQENKQWLSQLRLPLNKDVGFVFNSPGPQIPMLPGVMAAFHKQRMMFYTRPDIESLFQENIPGSEVIWEKPREQTKCGIWGTWLILSPAAKRQKSFEA